jgi:hypothetical protein
MLDGIVYARLDTGIDGIHHELAIFGVHTLKKCFVARPELAWLKTEHGLDLLRPIQIAGRDVPIPATDVGCPLGERIPFLAALQSILCLLSLRDLASQLGVDPGQFVRPCRHQLFETVAVTGQLPLDALALGDVTIAGPVP